MDSAQVELLRDLTRLVAPALGLDPVACRHLWMRAVRSWEVAHSQPANVITSAGPSDRARSAIEIRDHFIVLARELLQSPDQRAALSSAIEEAFALYMQKYNQRPR